VSRNGITCRSMRLVIILALVLAGCATGPQKSWVKPGGTIGEYQKDDRECEYDGCRVFNADINSPLRARMLASDTYQACMRSRGYVLR
jgi:hypothetical protein